jgi:hypothetical protein
MHALDGWLTCSDMYVIAGCGSRGGKQFEEGDEDMVPMLPLARAKRSPSELELSDAACEVDAEEEEESAMLGSAWYHKSPGTCTRPKP